MALPVKASTTVPPNLTGAFCAIEEKDMNIKNNKIFVIFISTKSFRMHGDYREILYPHANKDLEVVYNKNDEPKRVVTSDEEDDFASGVVVGVVVQELQLEFVVQLQLQLQFPFP